MGEGDKERWRVCLIVSLVKRRKIESEVERESEKTVPGAQNKFAKLSLETLIYSQCAVGVLFCDYFNPVVKSDTEHNACNLIWYCLYTVIHLFE